MQFKKAVEDHKEGHLITAGGGRKEEEGEGTLLAACCHRLWHSVTASWVGGGGSGGEQGLFIQKGRKKEGSMAGARRGGDGSAGFGWCGTGREAKQVPNPKKNIEPEHYSKPQAKAKKALYLSLSLDPTHHLAFWADRFKELCSCEGRQRASSLIHAWIKYTHTPSVRACVHRTTDRCLIGFLCGYHGGLRGVSRTKTCLLMRLRSTDDRR